MPKGIVSALALAAVAVGVIVAFQMRGDDGGPPTSSARKPESNDARTPRESAGMPPAGPRSPTAPDAAPPREPATSDHPAVRRQLAYRDLESRLRSYLAGADRLPSETRRTQADALMQAVVEAERIGTLLPPEALALQIALLRARAGESGEWRAEADALTARYRLESDARERAARSALERDPRFVEYKRREVEIVREIMALPETVGGRPRDAILRERLDEARRATWGDAERAPIR
jgi:hypothetical protein